jgi:signal recognition particle receptor subunit beta
MVLFNYATKEITAKIVYYGPGLCGKTTNLQFVYESLPSSNKSKMLSLATKTDRTLFFDFLPLDLGKIRGMRTKLQLYTVPGQVYYNSTRQLVLKGADGIVFVADSQEHALDANLESLQNLEDNLKRQGVRIREIPLVLQYNKRDLPNAMPIDKMNREINKLGVPHYASVATTGIGVEEALKGITTLVLAHLVKKYGLEGSEPLERDIQILNATVGEPAAAEGVWEDGEETLTSGPGHSEVAPLGEPEYELDDASGDQDLPVIPTELLGSAAEQRGPFDQINDLFDPNATQAGFAAVPLESIEIPLPPGITSSLPDLQAARSGSAAASVVTPPAPPPANDRRAADALVREVTIPLNLSLEEIRQHKRLRLKITLDVNLLP